MSAPSSPTSLDPTMVPSGPLNYETVPSTPPNDEENDSESIDELFDWNGVIEHCDGTPKSLYETMLSAYRKPRSTPTQELANDLASVAMQSQHVKHKQAANFVLLMLMYKLSKRDDLTEHIQDAWHTFANE